ncbi:MAG: phosphoribosylformylglycinamidine synthase [Candidatus Buchananbacteria bacterium]
MRSFYRWPALSEVQMAILLAKIRAIAPQVTGIQTEWRFYIETAERLTRSSRDKLRWLMAETFEPKQARWEKSSLAPSDDQHTVFEIGPRKCSETPWSTNAGEICGHCGITEVSRIERVRRYSIIGLAKGDPREPEIAALLFDRMTEQIYESDLKTFVSNEQAPATREIDVISRGVEALTEFCVEYGLSLDNQLKEYIVDYYRKLGRNPSDIEIFMFGQLNSEHCRHRIFNGQFIIDGVAQTETLFAMIKATCADMGNVAVAFSDNSAILQPLPVKHFIRGGAYGPEVYRVVNAYLAYIDKNETHNHPTGICSYPGAATAMAVRRDGLGAGRGGLPKWHLAMLYVGQLFIPGYNLPWEKRLAPAPTILETPLEITKGATDGASDNCNCYGNPVILGSFTSFGQMVGDIHYEYLKPVAVAGSYGLIDYRHIQKGEAQEGMALIVFGGTSRPIGVGGGSGSSKDTGTQAAELDYQSVQRDDGLMEQLNANVVRVCSEQGDKNPIVIITDLGAGGLCVGVTELVHPLGADVYLNDIPSGDPTMARWVLFGNEAQERMVCLVREESLELWDSICKRQCCHYAVIGKVRGDGKYRLHDKAADAVYEMDMSFLLADLPQMRIECETVDRQLQSADPISDEEFIANLDLVLRHPTVCRKSCFTDKGDMTVGGLVARNQIVGPARLPLSDCAVMATSFFGNGGVAKSIGEAPVVGLVDNEAGVEMAIGEGLTNLALADVDWYDINYSGTWQWPCNQSGENARLYYAVRHATAVCGRLKKRIPVGKDSCSMSVKFQGHTTRSPGTLQMITFAPTKDIRQTLTPDIKDPGKTKVMLVDLAGGLRRLGGSILLQVRGQLGNVAPRITNELWLEQGFKAIGDLNRRGLILSAHDRSAGGLIVAVLEMAFAGNSGLNLSFEKSCLPEVGLHEDLFAHELGWVVEFRPEQEAAIRETLRQFDLEDLCQVIGETVAKDEVTINYDGKLVLHQAMSDLRAAWSETCFQIDALQCNPEMVQEERVSSRATANPKFRLTFKPMPTPYRVRRLKNGPPTAIITFPGTNGDVEAAAACLSVGLRPEYVHFTDLASGRATLRRYQGAVWPGGFANKDVFDAGKGPAAAMRFDNRIADDLAEFEERADTFMFGPCNGNQTMNLMGLVPWRGIPMDKQPRFIRNKAERFQSRQVNLTILPNNCVLLDGMAGSILPVWVAHGEGRFVCPSQRILSRILELNLAPVRYVDLEGEITEQYPYNPNGSPLGIAGLCSKNGRFLAMMPHPERCFRLSTEQSIYWPPEWVAKLKASPWLRLFQNAYRFAIAA